MLTLYMLFWSIVTMVLAGVWRVRSWSQIRLALITTTVLLLGSQYIFSQLSTSVGLPPNLVLLDPMRYLGQGPTGWLALLIMPVGWISPVIALQLMQRENRSSNA